jgi:hypothetical protein
LLLSRNACENNILQQQKGLESGLDEKEKYYLAHGCEHETEK